MTIKSNFKFIIDTYSAGEKVQLFQELYKDIAGYGIDGDEELAHINSFEAKVLKSLGGSGTINEITELPQYFGGGERKETETYSKADIPEVLKPYVKDILKRARTRMEEAEEAGYEAYPGERIAEIDPAQEAAQERLLALLGTQEPYLEEALEGYRAAARAPTSEEIQGYMSPYQQAVTDIERRKAGEAYEGVRKAREAKMIGGGGMSGLGSRAAIEMGRGEQAHLQSLADIQSKGSQRGWQDAQQRLAEQRTRQRAGAGDVRGIGKDIYGTRVSEIGLGAQVGEQRRQYQQEQLDDLYRRYMEKKQFPEQELAKYSGLVYGMPTGFLANQETVTRGPKGPSFGQQLLGAGLQLGSAYLGGPGGAALTNQMFSGGGGGGGGYPVQGMAGGRAAGGLVARQNGGLPNPKEDKKAHEYTMRPISTDLVPSQKVGLSSLLETIATHSKEMRDIREKYKTARRDPFLGPLADFLGATGESIGGNIPVAGPLKERLGAAKTLTQKQQEQAMALDLKELESEMDVKKAVMLQKLKSQAKDLKYSASMKDSLELAARSVTGIDARYVDGILRAVGKKELTPAIQRRFEQVYADLEHRAALYQSKYAYSDLASVAQAKRDMKRPGKLSEQLPSDLNEVRKTDLELPEKEVEVETRPAYVPIQK